MTRPLPNIPWLSTGNHWIALPCIHPADGALHAVGLLHRGSRAAIEFAGSADFVQGAGEALLKPTVTVDGVELSLAATGVAWERALGWLPTFTCVADDVVVRGTIFAPYGRDADMAGVVYAITVENRRDTERTIDVRMRGTLGHRQQRVRTPRPFDDSHVVAEGDAATIILDGSAIPGVAALAIGADGDAELSVDGTHFAVGRTQAVAPRAAATYVFLLAAGPERDGAIATVGVMRRRGWRTLLAATREALQTLEQATGDEGIDRLVNRNLLFAYFYGVGRALDDAHYYLVRTRTPWHALGVTIRDVQALLWTLSAVQLADTGLARELLVRCCELHGYAPGQGTNYFDGTLFEPGFAIEGPAAYAIAVDRYIRDANDDQLVEEPVVADTLYLAHDDLAARRHERHPLYATEVTITGEAAAQPFTLHGNAVAALALDVFRRTLDEEAAREVEDPAAVRAAVRRHFVRERDGKPLLATASDLGANVVTGDDAFGSVAWLPVYDALDREESLYRRSLRAGDSTQDTLLVRRLGRLLGPDGAAALGWLRRAPLDQGIAASVVDADGRALGDGGDAALAGLLAWTAWYAVHALGIRAA